MTWVALVRTLPVYIALLSAVVWLTVVETERNENPLVRLEQGTFRGTRDEAHQLEAFRGIRYALPPINELRFRRPKPVWEGPLPDRLDPHNRTTSDGKFDASFYGPSCAQYIPPAFMAYRPPVPPGSSQEVSSEDCLSVNVFRPSKLGSKVPVLVWIYGGAWMMGADFPYEHTNLVKQSVRNGEPIIVVTFNYRVGAYGFLSGKAMQEQADAGNVDLNIGLHDQRTALRWIKRNIHLFGGDSDRITLAGESAGGQSISYHLLSQHGEEKDEQLFHQAIIQSGGSAMAITRASSPRHEHHYKNLLSFTPCSRHQTSLAQIECLRALPPAALSAANVRTMMYVIGIASQANWKTPVFFPFWPTLDNDFITRSPYELWMEGKYKDVPMIFGNVLDEGTVFTPHDLHNETVAIPWIKRTLLPGDDLSTSERRHTLQKLLEAYPDVPAQGSPFALQTDERLMGQDNQYKRVAAALGDIVFQAPRRYQIRQHSLLHAQGKKKSPAWNYLLAEAGPGSSAAQGVPHGTDNDYLFRPMAQYLFFRPPVDYRTPGSRWDVVAKTLTTAWIGFVNRGHPNREGVPRWPYYAPLNSDPKRRLPISTLQIQAYNNTIIPDNWREAAMTQTLIEDVIVRKALAY